jgi:hypothetical protein
MTDSAPSPLGSTHRPSLIRHSAERWAQLVWAARNMDHDPRTLAIWADVVGMSVPTLRTRCYMAGVSPRSSLALARLVRAVACVAAEGGDLADMLDVREPRTARRLLAKCGLATGAFKNAPLTIGACLDVQALVRIRLPLESLQRLASPAAPAPTGNQPLWGQAGQASDHGTDMQAVSSAQLVKN